MTDADILLAGISAAKAGDSKKAAALLAQVVRANPASEAGWFWLGLVCQSLEQRSYCFKRVLALNPLNAKARELLNMPASTLPFTPDSAALSFTHPAPASSSPPAAWEAPAAISSAPEPVPKAGPASTTPFAPPMVSTRQSPPTSPTLEETPLSSSTSLSPAPNQLPLEGSLSEVSRWNTSEKILVMFLGCLLAILLCGGALGYLIMSRQFSQLTDRVAAAIWSSTPTPTASVTPSITPTPTYTLTPTPTLIPTRTPSSTSSPTLDYASRSAIAKTFIDRAKLLMYKKMHSEAIDEWDQVIIWVPENADAYYQRASCYLELIPDQRSHDVYLAYLNRALVDLDRAIALDSGNGDYYIARYRVYERRADDEPYRLDYASLEEIALDNLRVANQLGNTEPDSERDPVFVLFNLGRCEEGMTETRQLLAERGPTAPPSAGLNYALAEGYLCLGQLGKALEHINLAIELYPEWGKTWTKIIILYNLGRLDEALALLNDDIMQFPYYAGYRYFLRAAIYAEQVKLADAEADIEFGYGQIWGYYGIVSYAEGRLALKRNDRAAALENFQYAEATLHYSYGPLIKRIQREIANLGGQPLTVTPQAFMVASIATPRITATPHATSTFVYRNSLTATPMPQPPPQSTTTITYDVYWSGDLWLNAIGGSIMTEDFEKDVADYGELSFPYLTGNGFLLAGQSSAQILQDAALSNNGNLLHFRDWKVGLTFTFPNNTDVSGFGFDYKASETWQLTVSNSVITIPAGSKGFVGIVIHAGNLNKFILSCTNNVQGGLWVDNISFVKK